MRPHQVGGAVAVALLDRLDDRAVLLDIAALPFRRAPTLGEQPPADVGDPRASRSFTKARFPVAAATATWKARLASCAASDVRAASSASIVSSIASRSGSECRRSRKPCDPRLEHETSLEPVTDVAETGVGDEEAPVDLELDEPVARKPPQRLAHRATRDAEAAGELGLAESRSRRERAGDDQRADLVVGEPDHGVHPQGGRRARARIGARGRE